MLAALKARDGSALAPLVHPDKGVRFSPYAFVHSDSDVVIPAATVAGLFADTTRRLWGHADGTGDPLRMAFADYYKRFVYDLDFGAAPTVRVNGEPIRPGNAPSNLKTAYPGARWVEFHYPQIDQRYEGMDWRSLWLVFEPHGSEWRLTGVVHGSWTI